MPAPTTPHVTFILDRQFFYVLLLPDARVFCIWCIMEDPPGIGHLSPQACKDIQAAIDGIESIVATDLGEHHIVVRLKPDALERAQEILTAVTTKALACFHRPTPTIPDKGELLDGDFRFQRSQTLRMQAPESGQAPRLTSLPSEDFVFDIYSCNDELDLDVLFPPGFHGEVQLDVEGVHWAMGIKRDGRVRAHLHLRILPEHRANSLEILTNAARVLREAFWPADLPDHTHVRAADVANNHRVPLNLAEVYPGLRVCTRGPGGARVYGIVAEIGKAPDGRDALCIPDSPFIPHFKDDQERRWYYADTMGLVPLNAGTGRAHWHQHSYTLSD